MSLQVNVLDCYHTRCGHCAEFLLSETHPKGKLIDFDVQVWDCPGLMLTIKG